MQLVIVFFTALANLILGFAVYRKNPKSATHTLLALIAIVIALWTVTNYFSLNSAVPYQSLFWIQMVMFVTSPLGPLIYLFLTAYPNSELKINPRLALFIVSSIAIVAIISLTSLMFSSVSLVNGVHPQPGPGIILFGLLTIGFLAFGFKNIILKYKQSKGLVRLQLQYLVLGVILTFSLQFFTNFVFVILMNYSNFVVFGPTFSLILVGSLAYAIVRHRFLDIRLVVARTIAYTILVFLIAVFYIVGFFLLGTLFIGETSKQEIWVSTILTLIVAFSFQTLQRKLEKLTDKIFYKDHYDARLLLEKLGRIMASYISLEELTSNLFEELFAQVKISQGVLLLIKDNHISWVKTVSYEKTPEFDENEITQIVEYLHNNHQKNQSIMVFEELEEGPIKNILRRNNFNLVFPLVAKQETLGLLALGEKASGDLYSNDDLQVFDILIPQMAIAIQNSIAYEEIRRFSVVLKEEVERATSDLQKANERLKELDKLKDEFVSVASHELRTPMTAIKSYLWMALNKSPKPLNIKTKEYLDIAIKSTDRLIGLVQDLLTISRIEGKRLILDLEKTEIGSLVQQIYKELKIKADENHLQLSYKPAAEPLTAKIDKTRMMEVLENLLGNALKFTPEGGKVSIATKKSGSMIEVRVSDTGPGIADKDQELLFQKFNRLDNTQTTAAPGTGLGLYIAKQIVTLHGGQIWVESKLGEGTTFAFSLPVVKE